MSSPTTTPSSESPLPSSEAEINELRKEIDRLDAEILAAVEGLVVLTIADLIAWRLEHDPVAQAQAEVPTAPRVHRSDTAHLHTVHGEFEIVGYRDLRTGAEHVALVSPTPSGGFPLVRVHSECLTGDAFDSLRCDCGPQLHTAMSLTAQHGGAVVYLRGHEGRGIGLLAKISAYALQDAGRDTVQANLDLGWPADRREYGAAAAILADLGLTQVRLLTNNPAKAAGLRALGVQIAEVEPLEVGRTPYNEAYLETKRRAMGHLLSPATLDVPDMLDRAVHNVNTPAPALPSEAS
ncbi:MAG: GTP cyclohydrolase II, partial [Micrococcales bacterium]|nr:GTP cyclohydrolase II [Micrococcales bacterium]